MPKMTMSWPNRITVARILLIIPFVICMMHMQNPRYVPWSRYGALVLFLIMAISDAIDGWLARRQCRVTKLGELLDPMADKLLVTAAYLLLAGESTSVPGAKLPVTVVVMIISKDLYVVLGFLAIYLMTSQVKVQTVTPGKWSTFLQVLMVVAVLISPEALRLWPGYMIVVKVLWWAVAAMAMVTVVYYTRIGSVQLGKYEQNQKHE